MAQLPIESNVYALAVCSQTNNTTPATAPSKRLIQVAGDFSVAREDGSENWSDLDRFGDSTDFVNTLIGNGNPSFEAQANELAYLCWLFFGQETFTAKNVGAGTQKPPKFIFTPGTTTGYWSTW